MFKKPLEYIFLPSVLKEAYTQINKNSCGIDEVGFTLFEKELKKNIEKLADDIVRGKYVPEPLKKIEIDKPNSDEKRPIAISAIKDKIVQKVLYENLHPYYNKQFSDKSYAYRLQKSTMKAINRVTQFLNEKKLHVVKTDIDNFFETIDHEKLLELLAKDIQDKRILKLIALMMEIGSFQKFTYNEHLVGVHQGDILSPLFSNIYLNEMDNFLETQNIAFVRYADDFVMLFNSKNEAYNALKKLQHYLKSLKLKLEKEKTSVVHISEGFVFLGVRFEGRNRLIENERFLKTVSKIHQLAKTGSGFVKYIDELNIYLLSLKNYYLQLITKNATQHTLLQNALIESVAYKVYLAKESKQVKTKKEFRNFVAQISFDLLFEDETVEDKRELAIAKGIEKYLANKSYKAPGDKIAKKKNQYAKKFSLETTLHIQKHGLMLGISKNKFVLKEYGRVIKRYAFDRVTRVIFEGKGFALSSDVLKKCADNNISVDFIDTKSNHYASLITYKASLAQNIAKQALVLNSPLRLELAKSFIKGKAKNQINYLKYMNKYHQMLEGKISQMQKTFLRIKTASDVDMLMGLEGSISVNYWDALRLLLDVPFERRITQGAKDLVNSSLNYGYAILYGQVQHALVHAGLSLNISFLHALDANKPTLTFDMIEEFRTFVVDRVIVAMLNKDEPVKLGNDGLLTKASRKLIAKNIKEKLGSYTMWKKESQKVENIIQKQAYQLAAVVSGKEKKYKPFVGKF
ncbi:CRISPR-associated endonuclease Cas1 [Sulfurimonas sp. SWIR-19]|uniref:CRISPR-associated endonuclease Cas1 n=1 Tax=Sulfurimonas sp. SWIR-19 TaxID=2878390 RepID=UPI001CF13E6E|nr:CRISPR-associated endonuclease Cas1 [Sulfurimonas sp. SWIR-19]UCN01258.1 CRISPR-associated endonuclease Cas1 [Sulfurimonas sp. SWIR-19]